MEIIMPIGISGSGKSRLYKMRYSDLELVSPDLIRKELTGDISNQTMNSEVFEEVDRRIDDLVRKGRSFYYDATNVNTKLRKNFVNKYRGNPNVRITYVILPSNMDEAYARIKDDIKNKVDRSKVPFEAIIRQKGFYNASLKSNFEGENVQEIVYLKPEDLA